MKFIASVVKSLKENLRDWKVLAMVLTFSPFFVLLMFVFYGGGATTYHIGIINEDEGKPSLDLIQRLKNEKGQDGSYLFEVTLIDSRSHLMAKVKEKAIDLGIVIPDNYSAKLSGEYGGKTLKPAAVRFFGSLGNMKYTVSAVMASDTVYKQGIQVGGIILPSNISETFLEKKLARNEFEGYVPGLISLAVLMVLFTASASIVKENEKKTLIRLKLSRIGVFNFLAGESLVQAVVAIVAIALAYGTALGLGYRPAGGFGAVLIVGVISSFSMVAVSLVVASFLDTVFDVLTIGCFPFFIFMFFSGSMFPLPELSLFTLWGHSFQITDIMPLTHTVNAFNKILNYGAGPSGVRFDIAMIAILTVMYFIIGLILYNKRKFSKA